MERDTSLGILANNGIISTHTLTWSVTEIIIRNIAKIGISTHTLTWSVTDDLKAQVDNADDFNSHAHVERDRRR